MRQPVTRTLAVVALDVALTLVPTVAGASVTAAKSNCKYLKVSEVERVLGTDVKKGPRPVGPPTARVCGYIPTDETLPGSVNVWVQSGSDSKIAFSVAKSTFKSTSESAPGLGRKSFYAGGGINTAYVLKGSTLVYVQYINFGGDAAVIKDAVVKLTKIVVGRV